MNNPKIAIIVDHPERDLAGLLLTAYDLCQRGATCYLIPYNLQEQEIFPLAPDFVLLNFVREGNDGLARRMAAAGIQFGALDTEGGVWPSPDYYSELIWKDESIREKVSSMCLWGPKLASHLVKRGFFNQSQISVTGCPRFDLYTPMWRSLFSTNGAASKQRAGRILVNTNYSFTNPKFATPERNIQLYLEKFKISEERVNEIVSAEKQAIEMTIKLVRRLALDYPQAEVLLRPHPFERADCYQSEVSDLANVLVDASGPAQPQIMRADVVIQRSCTTGIEAAIASVPTLSPQWITAPNLNPMAEAVSIACASYSEMSATVGSILNGQFQPSPSIRRAVETVIGDWFYKVDGLSYKRVSDVVLRSLSDSRKINHKLLRKYSYGIEGAASKGWPLVSARLRHIFRLSPDWSFRRMQPVPFSGWTESKKHFDPSHVAPLIEKIHDTFLACGRSVKPVQVEHSRDRGEYSPTHHGYAITLSSDPV